MDQPAFRERLRALVDEFVGELSSVNDPRQAYDASTAVIDDTREFMRALGQARAVAVYRLWLESGQPSVAELGAELGCSRGRAHQLLSEGRRADSSSGAL